MSSSSGRPASVAAGNYQVVPVAEKVVSSLPPRPPPSSSSSLSALVEYAPPVAAPEDEDLEIKRRALLHHLR